MHVSVAHQLGEKKAIELLDRNADELIHSLAGDSVKIVDSQRTWNGPVMLFSFKGKKGIFSSTIRGVMTIGDHDVAVDAELPGIVKKMVSEPAIEQTVQDKIRLLLAA